MIKTTVKMKDTFGGRKAYRLIKKLGKLDIEFDFAQRVSCDSEGKIKFAPEMLWIEGEPAWVIYGLYILRDYVKTFILNDVEE